MDELTGSRSPKGQKRGGDRESDLIHWTSIPGAHVSDEHS